MRTKSLEEKTWKSEVRTRMTRRSLEERTWRSEVRTRSLEERTCESSLKRWCDPRREMQGWPSLSFLASDPEIKKTLRMSDFEAVDRMKESKSNGQKC